MPNNDIDKLFRAAKSGDEKTAAALAGEMKSSLSADKQQLTLSAINKDGKILYQLPIKKTR